MLKAISELKIDRNETGNADEVPAEVSTTTGNPSKDPVPGAGPIAAPVAAAGGSNIPRPPKFDPVLYKTINSISLRKQRPSLNRQHVVDAKNPALLRPESQTETRPDPGEQPEPEPLPFKAKLEAILQRGPSPNPATSGPGASPTSAVYLHRNGGGRELRGCHSYLYITLSHATHPNPIAPGETKEGAILPPVKSS